MAVDMTIPLLLITNLPFSCGISIPIHCWNDLQFIPRQLHWANHAARLLIFPLQPKPFWLLQTIFHYKYSHLSNTGCKSYQLYTLIIKPIIGTDARCNVFIFIWSVVMSALHCSDFCTVMPTWVQCHTLLMDFVDNLQSRTSVVLVSLYQLQAASI